MLLLFLGHLVDLLEDRKLVGLDMGDGLRGAEDEAGDWDWSVRSAACCWSFWLMLVHIGLAYTVHRAESGRTVRFAGRSGVGRTKDKLPRGKLPTRRLMRT